VFAVFGFLFGVLIARAPAENASSDAPAEHDTGVLRVEPDTQHPSPHLKIAEVRAPTWRQLPLPAREPRLPSSI